MGTLAHALEGFFTGHGLALATDQSERLAAGRRERGIDAVPKDLRPAVEAFAAFMMRSRDRALRAGTRPRTDNTVEAALAIVRDLAQFLHGHRGKQDWALLTSTTWKPSSPTSPRPASADWSCSDSSSASPVSRRSCSSTPPAA